MTPRPRVRSCSTRSRCRCCRYPSYGAIEAIALDLLDLIAGGAFKQLWVIYNAPVRRFQYTFVARRLLPLDMAPGGPRPARVKPARQTRLILTHLLSDELLVGLYQTVLDSGISEQLARMHTMRLATDSCERLVDQLTSEFNAARRVRHHHRTDGGRGRIRGRSPVARCLKP